MDRRTDDPEAPVSAASSPATFFAGIEQHPVETSAGPCDLPILYRDASLLGLFYRVPPDTAAALLPAALEPMVILGKALAFLCAFEYRETTVGVYNEIGLAIQAKPRGERPSLLAMARDLGSAPDQGLHVVNLPVTTEAARAAGVDIWGYPKYVTGITCEFAPDALRVELDGEFTLTMGRSNGPSAAGLPFVTWSVRAGRLIRTVIPVGHRVRYGGGRSVQLRVDGDGPTARNLRALGLADRRPMAAFRTDHMRSILPAGDDVTPA